jgi:hypothetical protein
MYFTQKYIHLHAYTNIRPPHHSDSVGICKYVLEIHAYTAADNAIYCSLEVICAHPNIYCIVRIVYFMSVYDTYSDVCLQYMYVYMIHILAFTSVGILTYMLRNTCIY